jgi:hypothetical protein
LILPSKLPRLRALDFDVESATIQLIDNSLCTRVTRLSVAFRTEDLTEQVNALQSFVLKKLSEIQSLLLQSEPQKERGAHCEKPWECGFQERCKKGEPEFPIIILGLRNKAFIAQVTANGWRDLREVSDTALENANALRILNATRSGQRVLTSEASAVLKPKRQINYLDFETWASPIPRWTGTRPYQQLPFQWSLHIDHGDGALIHRDFLATGTEFPVRAAAENLVASIDNDYPIATYTSFEHRTIETMIEFCPDLAKQLKELQARLLDLHPLVKQSYYHPDMRGSWSIKSDCANQ